MKYSDIPLVTIGIPVYNSEKFLAQAINSVLRQSYSNFELIITDDGSTDASVSIAQSFKDDRIKVIVDGQNRGISYRLNQQIELANGFFFARMDADDIMYPKRIEEQVRFMMEHPQTDIVGTAVCVIDDNNEILGYRKASHKKTQAEALQGAVFVHPSVLGRTSWFKQHLYKEEFIGMEDYELWIRTIEKSSFAYIDDILLFYRDPLKFKLKTYLFRQQQLRKFFRNEEKKLQHILSFYKNIKSQRIMRNKMFITSTVPQFFLFFKGQINVLKNLFDITLVSSAGEQLDQIASIHKVDKCAIEIEREISILKDFKSLFSLITLFYKQKPFIVLANSPKASLLSIIAAYLTNVPHRIYYVHGLRYQTTKGFKRKLLMFMERITCLLATEVIAVSYGMKKILLEDKITRKDVSIIWNGSVNGVDTDFFNRDKVEDIYVKNISPNDFVFGFIGRIVKDKGIEELINVFKKIKNIHNNIKLLILGESELHNSISKSTQEYILTDKDIIYVGRQSDVRPFIKKMNILVLPTHREGFGMVVIEAGAMEVPAIVTNIHGCSETIEDNKTGLLINLKDESDLYSKMLSAIENKNLCTTLGKNARERISKMYNQKQLWEEVYKFYSNKILN